MSSSHPPHQLTHEDSQTSLDVEVGGGGSEYTKRVSSALSNDSGDSSFVGSSLRSQGGTSSMTSQNSQTPSSQFSAPAPPVNTVSSSRTSSSLGYSPQALGPNCNQYSRTSSSTMASTMGETLSPTGSRVDRKFSSPLGTPAGRGPEDQKEEDEEVPSKPSFPVQGGSFGDLSTQAPSNPVSPTTTSAPGELTDSRRHSGDSAVLAAQIPKLFPKKLPSVDQFENARSNDDCTPVPMPDTAEPTPSQTPTSTPQQRQTAACVNFADTSIHSDATVESVDHNAGTGTHTYASPIGDGKVGMSIFAAPSNHDAFSSSNSLENSAIKAVPTLLPPVPEVDVKTENRRPPNNMGLHLVTGQDDSFVQGSGGDEEMEAWASPKARSGGKDLFSTQVVDVNTISKHRKVETGQKQVNQYVMMGTIGRGAYSKVKLCHHRDNKNDKYAMKILSRSILKSRGVGSTSGLRKFKREVAILKLLRHPHIIALQEVLDDPRSDKLYLVLEYADGGELMSLDEKNCIVPDKFGNNRIPEPECQRLSVALIDALVYAHSNGIAHRDIKPQNILIDFEIPPPSTSPSLITSKAGSPLMSPKNSGFGGNQSPEGSSRHSSFRSSSPGFVPAAPRMKPKLSDFGVSAIIDSSPLVTGLEGTVAFLAPEILQQSIGFRDSTDDPSNRSDTESGCEIPSWHGSFQAIPPTVSAALREVSLRDISPTLGQSVSLAGYPNSLASFGALNIPEHSTTSFDGNSPNQSMATPIANNLNASQSGGGGESMGAGSGGDSLARVDSLALTNSSILGPQEDGPPLLDLFRGDVWSFGLSMFVLVTGRHPWPEAHDANSLFQCIKTKPIHDIIATHIESHLMSELLGDFLRRCLAFDPADRPTFDHLSQHAWLWAPDLSAQTSDHTGTTTSAAGTGTYSTPNSMPLHPNRSGAGSASPPPNPLLLDGGSSGGVLAVSGPLDDGVPSHTGLPRNRSSVMDLDMVKLDESEIANAVTAATSTQMEEMDTPLRGTEARDLQQQEQRLRNLGKVNQNLAAGRLEPGVRSGPDSRGNSRGSSPTDHQNRSGVATPQQSPVFRATATTNNATAPLGSSGPPPHLLQHRASGSGMGASFGPDSSYTLPKALDSALGGPLPPPPALGGLGLQVISVPEQGRPISSGRQQRTPPPPHQTLKSSTNSEGVMFTRRVDTFEKIRFSVDVSWGPDRSRFAPVTGKRDGRQAKQFAADDSVIERVRPEQIEEQNHVRQRQRSIVASTSLAASLCTSRAASPTHRPGADLMFPAPGGSPARRQHSNPRDQSVASPLVRSPVDHDRGFDPHDEHSRSTSPRDVLDSSFNFGTSSPNILMVPPALRRVSRQSSGSGGRFSSQQVQPLPSASAFAPPRPMNVRIGGELEDELPPHEDGDSQQGPGRPPPVEGMSPHHSRPMIPRSGVKIARSMSQPCLSDVVQKFYLPPSAGATGSVTLPEGGLPGESWMLTPGSSRGDSLRPDDMDRRSDSRRSSVGSQLNMSGSGQIHAAAGGALRRGSGEGMSQSASPTGSYRYQLPQTMSTPLGDGRVSQRLSLEFPIPDNSATNPTSTGSGSAHSGAQRHSALRRVSTELSPQINPKRAQLQTPSSNAMSPSVSIGGTPHYSLMGSRVNSIPSSPLTRSHDSVSQQRIHEEVELWRHSQYAGRRSSNPGSCPQSSDSSDDFSDESSDFEL